MKSSAIRAVVVGCVLYAGSVAPVTAGTAGGAREDGCAFEVDDLKTIPFLGQKKTLSAKGRKKEEVCLPRYFVADKDTPVFDASDGGRRVNTVYMGNLYFGSEEAPDRVRLATYRRGDGVLLVGWVDKESLLENSTRSLSLDDARKRELYVHVGELRSALRENNALHLRVVTQPDRRTGISKSPGGVAVKDILSWRWYYVFDTEEVDGRTWGLLSRRANVLEADRTLTTTDVSRFRDAFVGWAPLDEMTIWATQLVLEVNTAKEAVAARKRDMSPAKVYAIDRSASKVMWKEPLDDWYRPGALVQRDPQGVGHSVSRLVVIQPLEGGYVEVASSALRKGDVSSSMVDKLREGLQGAIDELMEVNIALVFDATGSMVDDIESTKRLFRKISRRMREAMSSGRGESIDEVGILDDVKLNFDLVINLSIIGFKDTLSVYRSKVNAASSTGDTLPAGYYNTHNYISNKNIATEWNDIESAFDRLIRDTQNGSGGIEALHDGLTAGLEALDSSNVLLRGMILITDEPGDTSDLDSFIRNMPGLTSEDKNRYDVDFTNSLETKKARTGLFSVYIGTGDCDVGDANACRTTFRRNVERASRLVFDNVAKYTGDARVRREEAVAEAVGRMLTEHQDEAVGRVDTLYNILVENKDEDKEEIFSHVGGVTKWAVLVALERNELTLDDLRGLADIVYYHGYVPTDEIALGECRGESCLAHSKWRLRVLLRKDDMNALNHTVDAVCDALLGLERDLPDWMRDDAATMDPRALVARLVLTVTDKVSGRMQYYHNPDILTKHMRGILAGGDADMRRLVNIAESLPLRLGGFLSMNLQELLDKPVAWFWSEKDRLCRVTEGLTRILEGETVPEDPVVLDNFPGSSKRWFYAMGAKHRVRIAHVPIGYIP